MHCRSRNYIFGRAIARANYETNGVSFKKTGGTSINHENEKGCRDGKLVKTNKQGTVSCAVVVNDHMQPLPTSFFDPEGH